MTSDLRDIPRTTFVMPNYNQGSFLAESLPALIGQRDTRAKIIFIDDCSTDDSVSIARSYLAGRKDSKLIALPRNRGVIAALNEGLALVDTPFVAFAAADDRLRENFLVCMQGALQAVPAAALAVSRCDLIDATGRRIGGRPAFPPAAEDCYISPVEVGRLFVDIDNFLIGNVALYRTERLREIGGFDPELASHADGMAMRLLAARHGFCFVAQTLGCWRQHDLNYSSLATFSTVPEGVARAIRFLERHRSGSNRDACFPVDYPDRLARRTYFSVVRSRLSRQDYRSSEQPLAWLRLLTRLPTRTLRAATINLYLYLLYRPYGSRALLRFARDRLRQAFKPEDSSLS